LEKPGHKPKPDMLTKKIKIRGKMPQQKIVKFQKQFLPVLFFLCLPQKQKLISFAAASDESFNVIKNICLNC